MTGDAEQNESRGRDAHGPGADEHAPASSADALADLQARLAAAEEQSLRLAAELDNVRKRGQREVENARKYGVERLAQALLPVCDSLEAALAADHLDVDTLLEGQRATLRLLGDALRDVGIEPIDPRGEPFDPTRHEAMSLLPVAHAEPDSVVQVVQKGYTIADRLLRPARVIVSQAVEAGRD